MHYKGYWNITGKCGVSIIKKDGFATVMLTELPDNPGTSVTNFVEDLATMIYNSKLFGMPIEDITWIEHYIYPETKGNAYSSKRKQ